MLTEQVSDFLEVYLRHCERVARPGRWRVFRNDKDQVIFEDLTKAALTPFAA